MIVERIRSILSKVAESERPYDKRCQMLACPTFFYIAINYVFTVLRTYQAYNDEGAHLSYYLSDDIQFQGLKGVTNQKLKFYLIQTLIFRSFYTRIVALFIQAIVDYRQLNFAINPLDLNYIEFARQSISTLTKEQYLLLVDNIY